MFLFEEDTKKSKSHPKILPSKDILRIPGKTADSNIGNISYEKIENQLL